MGKIVVGKISGCLVLVVCLCLLSGFSHAETLNPEGINPHVDAPRKKITEEQKKAAWEARKKKQNEIESRKDARKAPHQNEEKNLAESAPVPKP